MKNFASYFDNTLLKPDATEKDIKKLCAESKKHKFASVCVNPIYVSLCSKLLRCSSVKVCTVIGFPLGASTTETKVFEAKQAIKNGADELDMVINIGALKSHKYKDVNKDIKAVKKAAGKKTLKVILETAYLTNTEKIKASALSQSAGADFIKTSTSFAKKGADFRDIILLKNKIGKTIKIKASGGIKTYNNALKMINSGADRIGSSSSVNILKQAK